MRKLGTGVTEEQRKSGSKRLVIGIVLLLFLCAVTGTAGVLIYRGRCYHQELQRAEEYYEARDYRNAVSCYQNAMEYDRQESVEIARKLASCYVEMNHYEDAIKILQNCYAERKLASLKTEIDGMVEKLLNQEYEEHVERGNLYSKAGDYVKAIHEYSEAFRLAPESEEALYLVIRAYLANGQIDRAKKLYIEVKDQYDAVRMKILGDEIDEADVKVQYELLLTQAEDFFYSESEQECYDTYRQAIELMPENMEAYEKLVDSYITKQEYQKAADSIRQYKNKYGFRELDDLEKYIKDQQEKEECIQSILKKLYQNMTEGDAEKILHQLKSKKYQKWIETGNTYYYDAAKESLTLEIPARKGLVIYGSGYIYCGGFENDKRSGTGKYFGLQQDLRGYFLYTGEWKEDVPNGDGALDTVMNLPYQLSSKPFVTTVQGTYRDGLENGRMRRDFYKDGSYFGSMEYRSFFGIPQSSSITINNYNWSNGYTYVIGNLITIIGTSEFYYTVTSDKWGVPGI